MNAKFFFPIFITLALAAAALADEEENKNCPFKACEQYITKEEALKKLMGEDEVQYCEDENLKPWSECFFEHIGILDHDQNVMKIDSHDKFKSEDNEEKNAKTEKCALDMINLDNKSLRSCNLMECFQKSRMFDHH